jgi:hypothetical protein
LDEQPLRRKWVPSDEAALRAAFEQGLLDERNWCDLKKLVGTTRGASADLAKDLASFAVDGGTILIGLDETAPEGNPFHPVELTGLAERIEQISHTRIHPPLLIDCTPVPAGDHAAPGTGYLIVHIPASPQAPHQVDGVYYGRGDKTNRRLTDPEVERLFRRRATWNEGIEASLHSLMSFRDADRVTTKPQLFLAARPVAAWPDMCLPLTSGPAWQQTLAGLRSAVNGDEILRRALDAMFPRTGWQTTLGRMSTAERTASGARLTLRSPGVAPGNSEWDVDLDVDESGTLWFFAAEIGLADRSLNGMTYTGIFIDAISVYILAFLTFATLLSDEVHYASSWDVGIGLTNLHGCRPIAAVGTQRATTVGAFGSGYEAARYVRTGRADVAELSRRPGAVLERLIGQLARAMLCEGYLRPLTDAGRD